MLTISDTTNPLWIRLKDYFEDRLESLRTMNDNVSLTDAETAALRGRIAEVKAFLALADDRPPSDE